MYSNLHNGIPLSLTDFHRKGDFIKKLSNVQCEEIGGIWWTLMNPGKRVVFLETITLLLLRSAPTSLLRSCAANTGGQRKLIYLVYFQWRPVEAQLELLTLYFLLKKIL